MFTTQNPGKTKVTIDSFELKEEPTFTSLMDLSLPTSKQMIKQKDKRKMPT